MHTRFPMLDIWILYLYTFSEIINNLAAITEAHLI